MGGAWSSSSATSTLEESKPLKLLMSFLARAASPAEVSGSAAAAEVLAATSFSGEVPAGAASGVTVLAAIVLPAEQHGSGYFTCAAVNRKQSK